MIQKNAKAIKRGIINLGYPCMCRSLISGKVTSKITQKALLSYGPRRRQECYDRLVEISQNNLQGLSNTIDWTFYNNIKFYRVYSDLFPHITNRRLDEALGNEFADRYRDLDGFEDQVKEIGKKIYRYGIRVTFHPNEYVCLGSPKEEVVHSGIVDLTWHAKVLRWFKEGAIESDPVERGESVRFLEKVGRAEGKKGAEEGKNEDQDESEEHGVEGGEDDPEDIDSQEEHRENVLEHFRHSVFVLHGGGRYGDKIKTMERFGEVFENLPKDIKDHLVLENDERNYNPMDLLPTSEKHKIPVIIDYFHQDCYEIQHPKEEFCDWDKVLPKILKVWKDRQMKVKFHVSLQQPERRLGTHSHYCNVLPDPVKKLQDSGLDFDIMLECKAKELALWDCYESNKDRIDMDDWIGLEKRAEIIKDMNGGEMPDLSEKSREEAEATLIGNSKTLKASTRQKQLVKQREDRKGRGSGKKGKELIEEAKEEVKEVNKQRSKRSLRTAARSAKKAKKVEEAVELPHGIVDEEVEDDIEPEEEDDESFDSNLLMSDNEESEYEEEAENVKPKKTGRRAARNGKKQLRKATRKGGKVKVVKAAEEEVGEEKKLGKRKVNKVKQRIIDRRQNRVALRNRTNRGKRMLH